MAQITRPESEAKRVVAASGWNVAAVLGKTRSPRGMALQSNSMPARAMVAAGSLSDAAMPDIANEIQIRRDSEWQLAILAQETEPSAIRLQQKSGASVRRQSVAGNQPSRVVSSKVTAKPGVDFGFVTGSSIMAGSPSISSLTPMGHVTQVTCLCPPVPALCLIQIWISWLLRWWPLVST